MSGKLQLTPEKMAPVLDQMRQGIPSMIACRGVCTHQTAIAWARRAGIPVAPPGPRVPKDRFWNLAILRGAGLSWREIGEKIGVSGEACRQQYQRHYRGAET